MDTQENESPVTRLRELADTLHKVYEQAGTLVAQAVKPVDQATEIIGVTFRQPHYAESLRAVPPEKRNGAKRPDTFVAEEEFEGGGRVEYTLCVTRGKDSKCRVRVSRCTYHVGSPEGENGNGQGSEEAAKEVTIDEIKTIAPNEMPLPIRVKVLERLDDFVILYEKHVRDERKSFLSGSVLSGT